MEKWYKVAESSTELFQSDLPVKEVNGKRICFSKVNNNIVAFSDQCPHAGGKLSQGYVDALGNIVCPLHRYKFRLTNGYNCSGEGYHLKTFAVKEDNGIWVAC